MINMQKIKNFLFEQEETSDDRNFHRGGRRPRGRNQNTDKTQDANDKWAWGFLIVLIPVVLFIVVSSRQTAEVPLNSLTLCPADEKHISGKTYILMDFSEPLSDPQRDTLRDLLKVASKNLKKHERLSISSMRSNPQRPREHRLDLCNPVDLENIRDTFGRSVDADKNCPDIIAKTFPFHNRVGKENRDRILATCKRFAEVKKNAEAAAEGVPSTNPEQLRSYIIGSIEDIMADANSDSNKAPTRFIAFSDMLQNAKWFSQYEKQHGEWTIDNIRKRREKHAPANMQTPAEHAFDEVLLCYLPNNFIGTAKRRNAHRRMWRDYFKKAGTFKFLELGGCVNEVKSIMGG